MSTASFRQPDKELVKEQTILFSSGHYEREDFMPVRGRGLKVYDEKGRAYLDMFAQYGATNFGHCHPQLVKALTRQAKKISLVSGVVYHPLYAELCEALSFAGLSTNAQTLLVNSGAEAVEKAIKIARRWGYQKKNIPPNQALIVVMHGNFHGRTLGVLSASDQESYRQDFGPLMSGFKHVRFNDLDNLAQILERHEKNMAAVLMEPILGEGGFVFPLPGYLEAVCGLCQKHNVLLIWDEIPTGLGRTGFLFPHLAQVVNPDLFILGKALGGGMVPISAVIGREEVMNVLDPGSDGSTFGGNPLACAVALKAMELLQEHDGSLLTHVQDLGEYFLDELRAQKWPAKVQIHGQGLFIGFKILPAPAGSFQITAKAVCQDLLRNERIWTHFARGEVVRLTPPLIITQKEVDFTVKALLRTLNRLVFS